MAGFARIAGQYGIKLTAADLVDIFVKIYCTDRVVFHYCHMAGAAVVVTMSGGYARKIEDSVDIRNKSQNTVNYLTGG